MKSIKAILSQNWSVVVLLSSFFLSRVVYFLIGIRFDSSLLTRSWHFISPELLISNFAQSIFYLHSQPPVMNIFIGLVLRLFPGSESIVFPICYLILGLVLMFSLYHLLKNLGVITPLALGITILFITSPAVILYENWLFYTYPVCVALVFAGFCCIKFLQHPRLLYSALLFFSLGLVALLWSFFHLFWLLTCVITIFLLQPQQWKRIILGFALPFLVVLGWYTKNWVVFGEFTASTWYGLNFSHITTWMLSLEEKERLCYQGVISRISLLPAFIPLEDYQPYFEAPVLTGIPVLDQQRKPSGEVNFNNIGYIKISRLRAKDGLKVLWHKPSAYLYGIGRALLIFFTPADDYRMFGKNRKRIEPFARVFSLLFAGQFVCHLNPGLKQTKPILHFIQVLGHSGLFIVLAYTFSFLYGITLLRRRQNPTAKALIFLWVILVYGLLIGNLTDVADNNRFRFPFDPLVLIFACVFMQNLLVRITRKSPSGRIFTR